MFNWYMFIVLSLICLPGNWIISKKTVPGMKEKLNHEEKTPSDRMFFFMLFIQNFILSIIAAAVGTALAPRIGLIDPLLNGYFMNGSWSWSEFNDQLIIGVVVGVLCAVVWLLFNYGYYRKQDDQVNVIVSEKIRREIGLTSRVLSGGIGEEVMFRWGLLSLSLWLGSLIVGEVSTGVLWVSIIITGVIFGWAHIPGYVEAGCKKTPLLVFTAIAGNLWVAIICGWLFWNYGLVSAIVVHMLFHILWYPVEKYFYSKEKPNETDILAEINHNRKPIEPVSLPKLKNILSTEKQIYLYAFFSKKMKRVVEMEAEGSQFSYHKNSGYLAIVIMMIHALILEAFAMHLLIRSWSEIAAWLLTASSIYMIIFLLGDYNAVKLSPLKWNDNRLYIRTGFRNSIEIPIENVKSINLMKRDDSFQKLSNKEKAKYRAINTVLLEMNQDTPLIELELNQPKELIGYYGVQKKVQKLYVTADDSSKLYHLLQSSWEEYNRKVTPKINGI